MEKTRILFICSENRLRSPTAEAVFSQYDGIEALGAGTNPEAKRPVSSELIEWADVILVMEKYHRDRLLKKFKPALKGKRFAVLHIPDVYPRMDPVLIHLLESKVLPYLRR